MGFSNSFKMQYMNNKLVWIIFLVLIGAGVTLRFSTSHEKMPIGCDEFGYLNLAKAMDEGKTFSLHSDKPFLKGLLDTLRREGISENEFNWMVAPHAYHMMPETDKIINQYPPGTSYILHLVPFEIRNLLFPLIVFILLTILPLVAAASISKSEWNWFTLLFALFIFIVTITAPFLTELTRVNSLAFTFGFLIAAGMLLKKFPLWACFLIALTVNFRTANIILLLPAILFLRSNVRELFSIKLMAAFFVIILIAIAPALGYNYLITGSPFVSTYSAIDQSGVIDIVSFHKAITYYFNLEQYWFRIHLLAILVLSIMVFTNCISKGFLGRVLLFPIINYGFFIYHSVSMDYYPYASAKLLIGVVFAVALEFKWNCNLNKLVAGVVLLIGAVVLTSGYFRYKKREHITIHQAQQKYQLLCEFDVVWADLFSGTTEYVCNNSGFRFGTTTPRARKLAMEYLAHHQFKQTILLDDNTVDSRVVLQEVELVGLKYTMRNEANIGKYIIIN
jgi:hypothetical protein